MKKGFYILAILLITGINHTQAQTNFYIGTEGAMTGDIYEVFDPCNIISTTTPISGYWSILAGTSINKNFFFESGFIRKYYTAGYAYTKKSVILGSEFKAFNTVDIPIKLKSRFNIFGKRLFLSTTVGYHYSIKTGYSDIGWMSASNIINGDTTNVYGIINNSLSKSFILLEAAAGFEYILPKGLSISLSSGYLSGLKSIYRINYTTECNICRTTQAIEFSKGNYWYLALGIKYFISFSRRSKKCVKTL